MVQSNKEAARILSKYLCSACTDITGFGLMGHLLEMLKFDDDGDESDENEVCSLNRESILDIDNKIAVELSLSAVPSLQGAIECVTNGILSSLHPQNIRCSRAVGNIVLGKKYASYPLLYDPQVCDVHFLPQLSQNLAIKMY